MSEFFISVTLSCFDLSSNKVRVYKSVIASSFNKVRSSLLPPNIFCPHFLSGVRPCVTSWIFLFFGSGFLSFSLVQFKKVFIPLIKFLSQSLIYTCFFVLLRYFCQSFSFISVCLRISAPNIHRYSLLFFLQTFFWLGCSIAFVSFSFSFIFFKHCFRFLYSKDNPYVLVKVSVSFQFLLNFGKMCIIIHVYKVVYFFLYFVNQYSLLHFLRI